MLACILPENSSNRRAFLFADQETVTSEDSTLPLQTSLGSLYCPLASIDPQEKSQAQGFSGLQPEGCGKVHIVFMSRFRLQAVVDVVPWLPSLA